MIIIFAIMTIQHAFTKYRVENMPLEQVNPMQKLVRLHKRTICKQNCSTVKKMNNEVLNSVCCIVFKRRWVKRSFKKSSNFLFPAEGRCAFNSCGVTLSIKVPTEEQAADTKNVVVMFSGQPTHNRNESLKGEPAI